MIVGNCKNIYYVSNNARLRSMESISKFLTQFVNYNEGEDEMDLPLSSGYDIIFSLMVPEPEILDCTWKIEDSVESKLLIV